MRRILGLSAIAVVVLAACGGNSNSPAAGGSPSAGGGAANGAGGGVAVLTVNTGTAKGVGTVLVDAHGLTLYYMKGESASNIECTGSCAQSWPPLLFSSTGEPTGGMDVTGTLSTVDRPDGMGTQVTYNGHPLYTWQGDSAPGQATGEGVENFSAATPDLTASGSSGGGGAASPSSSSGGGYGYP